MSTRQYRMKLAIFIISGFSLLFVGCTQPGSPPDTFKSLFNGEDLTGWCPHTGLPGASTGAVWQVENGVIVGKQGPEGAGGLLCTKKEFRDFEIRLETKIDWPFDSGVFLRVGPKGKSHQVTLDYRKGGEIGGIYCPWTQGWVQHCTDGIKHFKKGQWNDIRIVCRHEPAHIMVWINDKLLTDFQHTEQTTKGVPEEGKICLQVHPAKKTNEEVKAYFRNIFVREIARPQPLFNGEDLTGWTQIQLKGQKKKAWVAQENVLKCLGMHGNWLCTQKQYSDFILDFEFNVPPEGNSGVFIRAPQGGRTSRMGMEIQILDDYAERYAHLKPSQYTGSIYAVQEPSQKAGKKAGQWQKMKIICDGRFIQVILNGKLIVDANLDNYKDQFEKHPGLLRKKGYIGLQDHGAKVKFRNMTITELD